MINKQELREAIADFLEENTHYGYKSVPKHILNSKEFMQKIYRKNYKLFNWMPLYLDNKELWEEVVEEQEKIILGNAFNHFCKDAKLIKPNHNIDLDNMTSKEQTYYKAFKTMYEMNKEMLNALYKVSDYATYGIVCHLSNDDEFNYPGYLSTKQSGSLQEHLENLAKRTIEYVEDKGFE